ncbi:MAG TPA: type I DNA topoisomerase [Bryobacteraceae bacterium]|nr:type I DNA topoisomerase [Bryobacteraceae bacterium]
MPTSLVIVESPAKAKTIGKYLGKNYVVKFSLGHVRDLPKRDLAVDLEHGFEPTYVAIEGKKKLLSELKAAAKKSDVVYLAADPDREGEAICFHLKEELEDKKKGSIRFVRLMFNEITPNAIKKAFELPMEVDMHLVEAQQARRVLDRLVGYKISPLLWDKVRRGLSAGRVQSVAVRLIVEREREVRAFQKHEYWTVDAHLGAKKPPVLAARFLKRNDEAIEIPNEAAAQALIEQLAGKDYLVKSVVTREKKRNPVPSFITSTLQQESARKLRFSVKRTMGLAQRLYEGVEVGTEGPTGLITYMRTDSTRVSDEALGEARTFIAGRFGPQYVPETPNIYKSKKGAQDAHEAIRPTDVTRTPEALEKLLQEDELKLYRLIWMRFVASQMMPAIFDQTTIDIAAQGADGAEYLFRATGSVPRFDGFLAVYEEGKDQKDEEDEELKHRLPLVAQGDVLKFRSIDPEQHFTEPPPRYNEATLVKKLEADGVGRPSTYASIISTIQDRGYVKKEGGKFLPTELGMVVTDLLVEAFDDILDISYTARMEEELDLIEEGKVDWRAAIGEFYQKFSADLSHAEEHMTDIKRMEKPTDLVCDKCGKPMVIRWGKHGSFIGCSGYPECTSTRELTVDLPDVDNVDLTQDEGDEYCDNCGRPMVLKRGRFGTFWACSGYPDCKTTRRIGGEEKKADVPLDEKCPQCGNNLVLKNGRFGEFTACSNYPTCKYVKQKTIGVKCPECNEGDISERRSRRGKTFYGCTRYPDCKFVAWAKPLAEPCPKCGSKYLLEKWPKSGHIAQCPNPECKYKYEMAPSPAEATV